MFPQSPLTKTLTMVLQALLIAGVTTAAVILVTRSLGSPSLAITSTTTAKQSTFDATGTSTQHPVPDQAEVRMGVIINDSTVTGAQTKANTVINQLTTQLKQLGIADKDIQTENYSVNPNYDYSTGSTQHITGYNVNATLRVTMTDFSKLNQAIDAATAAGANQVGGVSFTLSDAKQQQVKDAARKEAIDQAKANAQTLASLAGMKLGKIVNVTETPTYPNPVPMYAAAGLAEAQDAKSVAPPTSVQPGTTTYTYQVTVSYETE